MGNLVLTGATSGSTTVQPTDAVTAVITLPSTSGTLSVSGGSPSFATLTVTGDASISGLTVGKGAGAVSTNTAVGASALSANTTGDSVIGVGIYALQSNTTGNNNIAIGRGSLASNTTGSDNVSIGRQALVNATTGNSNTAYGGFALYSNTTASNNTAVGYQAGYNATVGANTYIGYGAGSNHATGSNCTYVGTSSVQASSSGVNYELAFGGGITGQGSGYFNFGVNGIGVVYNQFSTNASWTRASDQRLKTNIQNDTLGLAFITALQPKTYTWKPSNEVPKEFTNLYSEENKKDTETVMHGLIAQEVKQALDSVGVSTFGGWNESADGCQGVASDMFIFPLINAVKELNAKVTALEAQLGAK